jgi:hypothetical protein
MWLNVLLIVGIFGYASWTMIRYVQKSKKGKCATCSLQKSCVSNKTMNKEADH